MTKLEFLLGGINFFRARALALGVLKYLKCYFSKEINKNPTTSGMYV